MKYTLSPVLIIVAGALSSCATGFAAEGASAAGATSCPGYVTTGADVDAIRQLEAEGAATNVTGLSREHAERMFAPGYVSVGADGGITPREEVMKSLTGGRSKPWATRFQLKELEVKVYCDMALAVALSEADGRSPSGEIRTVHFRWLNVWTRSDGGWRLSATQFARF